MMTELYSSMPRRFSRFVIFDWYRAESNLFQRGLSSALSGALFSPFNLTYENTYVYYEKVDSALHNLRPRYRAFGCHFVHDI